jgi:uncharacterized protein (DUF433 family)
MVRGDPVSALEVFSAVEIGAVVGASASAIHKLLSERLPCEPDTPPSLTRQAAICLVIDRDLPEEVPVSVRRDLYARIVAQAGLGRVQVERGVLSYVVDVASAARRLDKALACYRDAMQLIVEDDRLQAGAATFKGTRILVHQIADLLAQGCGAEALREDYPRLTPAMIAAAPVYARAHPRRGRPRKPSWRNGDKTGLAAAPRGQ